MDQPPGRLASLQPPVTGSSRGAALGLVLLLLVALTALGTGALTLARRQAVAARTGSRVLQATFAAEAGLLRVPSAWPPEADSLADGASVSAAGSLGPFGYALTVRRLERELFLVRSVGSVDGTQVAAESAALVWRLDPWQRALLAPAAVVHGGGLERRDMASVVDAGVWSPWCEGAPAAFRQGLVINPLRPDAPTPEPLRTAWDSWGRLRPFDPVLDPTQAPGLGLLGMDSLTAAASPLGPPATEDECIDSEGPGCPVAALHRVPAGEPITEGELRGVLVAEGGLRIAGEARFTGWLLAPGDVVISDAAEVRGLIRAGGAVHVEKSARIEGDRCAAAAASDLPWLRQPRFLPPGPGLGPLR